MTLLLTHSCQYAILVAIEDGRNFTAIPNRDLIIQARLDLQLPPPVDDLIPPQTLICTKPVECHSEPVWRTTLNYFLSKKLLTRVQRHHMHVTLDVILLNDNGTREQVGQLQLSTFDAKHVVMNNGQRDITVVTDYVIDKGEWHSVGKGPAQVRVGLFIVNMPPSADEIHRQVSISQRRPRPRQLSRHSSDSQGDLGLEIRSAGLVSDCISSPPLSTSSSMMSLDHLSPNMPGQNDGSTQYTFLFRVTKATYLSSLMKSLDSSIPVSHYCFEYAVRQQRVQSKVRINATGDTWTISPDDTQYISVTGDLAAIQDWMTGQHRIKVVLLAKYENDRDAIIGMARIRLRSGPHPLEICVRPIYDTHKHVSLSPRSEIARMTVEMGVKEYQKPSEDGRAQSLLGVHQEKRPLKH